MEQQLQKINTQSLSLEVKNLGVSLFHYNQLTPYPISDAQIIDWSKSISELAPTLTPEILKTLLDEMKVGRKPFDSKLGIQNIFNAYKKMLEDESSFLSSKIKRVYGETETEENISNRKKQDELRKLINSIFKPSYQPLQSTL